MNQDWSSLGRRMSETTMSLVPSSPALSAASAMSWHSSMMILWASSRREIWTGTSSLPRGGWGIGYLGDVVAHGDGDAAEKLDALGDGVHDFDLLFEVLIEEEMELVEGGAGDLPVMLLVHVADGDGVGEQLVELARPSLRGPWRRDGGACPGSRSRTLDLFRLGVPVGARSFLLALAS